jgi:hypothetical protein
MSDRELAQRHSNGTQPDLRNSWDGAERSGGYVVRGC